MSFLPIAVLVPVQAIMPAAEAFAGSIAPATRPLLGLGAVIAILMFFKPLLKGVLRAALLAVKSPQALWKRVTWHKLSHVVMLNRMARDFDATQPNLAAELRFLTRRD